MWILQENYLAKAAEILCGTQKLEMMDLISGHMLLRDLQIYTKEKDTLVALATQRGKDEFNPFTATAFSNLMMALPSFGKTTRFELVNYAETLETLLCREPFDRVYGLLKLIPWDESLGPPVPDYHTSACDLAIDATTRLGPRIGGFAAALTLARAVGVRDDAERGESNLSELLSSYERCSISDDKEISCISECSCAVPEVPELAVAQRMTSYILVHDLDESSVCISLYDEGGNCAHDHMDQELVPVREMGIARFTAFKTDTNGKLDLAMWTNVSVRPGDVMASLKLVSQRVDGLDHDCAVLRSSGNNYYRICGHCKVSKAHESEAEEPDGDSDSISIRESLYIDTADPNAKTLDTEYDGDRFRALLCFDARDIIASAASGRREDLDPECSLEEFFEFA